MSIMFVLIALIVLALVIWFAYHFTKFALFALSVVMWLVSGGTSFYRAKQAK